jgi:hypothetical protein
VSFEDLPTSERHKDLGNVAPQHAHVEVVVRASRLAYMEVDRATAGNPPWHRRVCQ